MKHLATVTAFLLTLLSVTVTPLAFAAGIPDTLQKVEEPSGPPAWISEEALQAAMEDQDQPAGSRLKSVGHLFDYWPNVASDLDQYASMKNFEIAPDGTLVSCEPWLGSYYHGERAQNLAELLELSTAVSSVRIVDSKPGFLFGQAGVLSEVEVLSILKDAGAVGIPQEGFFLYDRYARMVIDNRALCLGDRQVPRGKFLLFQISAEYSANAGGLPVYYMDGSALLAEDGTYYGALLDYSLDPEKLAQELPTLGQLLRLEKP